MSRRQPVVRILLVEDDHSIRRFVALALEDLDIELVECADVAQALRSLEKAPVRLVLSDLMLPGESGMALLQRLAQDDALRGKARLAVFSAGVSAQTRQQLEKLGIWRILPKPASLGELRACVEEAMQGPPDDAADGAPLPHLSRSQPQLDVIERYYGGDRDLFEDYRAMCASQFPKDVAAGDAACDIGDMGSLRHLSHSLKTVLGSLGYALLAQLAGRVEEAAAVEDSHSAHACWQALRPSLTELGAGKKTGH